MNIVITFAVSDFTGASRMGLHYIRALKAAGHNVSVIAQKRPLQGESVIDHLLEEGFHVSHLGDFSALISPALIWKIRDYLVSNNTDLAISMNQMDVKTTSWACRLSGVKYLAFTQNLRNFHGNALTRLLKDKVYGLSLRKCASAVIGVSDFVCQETIKRFNFPASKTIAIQNGIELDRFIPPPKKDEHFHEKLGIDRDSIVLVNVARVHPQKGQDLLLHALADLPNELTNISLLIVGPYDTTNDTRNFHATLNHICKTNNLNGKVKFCGAKDNIPEVLVNCDIYVHPSRWEGLPLSPLEAMATGLPVISSDCVGTPTGFIDGKHGYYVKAGNIPELTNALQKILQAPEEERTRMGDQGRKLVTQYYDIHQAKDKFVETVNSILGIRCNDST